MNKSKHILVLAIIFTLILSCNSGNQKKKITIFHVNDVHGQIKNMAKIKHIIDAQKEKNPTILVSAGDMFSGNPVVDNYKDPGYPMIDIMNQTGFNIAAIGNHEFDNGDSILAVRVAQSNFPWIIANANLSNTPIMGVEPFKTLTIDGIRVTFLGLIETGGMQGKVIPSTHPLDIMNISFNKAQSVLPEYKNLKNQENADIYITLSHLGHAANMDDMTDDFKIAEKFSCFDAIIGGHTHRQIDTVINNTPVFQAGSYLHHLGKIEFQIINSSVKLINSELINLDTYSYSNLQLSNSIDAYYNEMNPILDEEIGFSLTALSKIEVGCMYTTALKKIMQADLCIQNTGGIRSTLNEGPITVREVYEIDPFNNGTLIYQITVGEIKKFLKESNSGFYYSGLNIIQSNGEIYIADNTNTRLHDTVRIKLGMNDYAAAVHQKYFPKIKTTYKYTSSEMLIQYLRTSQKNLNFSGCTNYFKYE
jgi:2',3'-cyclic-nucleotide 2'-phosphodiesterase (5'-nucleotidase family)